MAEDIDIAAYIRVPTKNGHTGERSYTTFAQWLPWLKRVRAALEAADEDVPLLTVLPCVICGQPVSNVVPFRTLLRRRRGVRIGPCGCKVIQRFIYPDWRTIA